MLFYSSKCVIFVVEIKKIYELRLEFLEIHWKKYKRFAENAKRLYVLERFI